MRTLKLTFLATALMLTGTAAVKAQSADEIIQKHITAMGGAENWDKVKTIKMTGSMNAQGMDIDMILTVANEKGIRTDITVMGQKGYTIMTPKEGWMYMPFGGNDKVVPMPAEAVKMGQEKLNIKNGQLVDKSYISKAELMGKESLNGAECFKLKITDKSGQEQVAFFDAKTFYLVRSEAKANIQGEEQEMAVTYSNFQKQGGGIVYPMMMGTTQGDITYKSIEVNPVVSDAAFKPEEPKK